MEKSFLPKFGIVRLLAFATALLILTLALSSCAEETTELVYELTEDGTGYILNCEGLYVGEVLTVPAEYDGKPVVGIKDHAFKNAPNLTRIVFETEGVISVKNYAFEKCEKLTVIDFTGGGEFFSDDYAFYNTTSIETVNIGRAIFNFPLLGSAIPKITLDGGELYGEANIGRLEVKTLSSIELSGGMIDEIVFEDGFDFVNSSVQKYRKKNIFSGEKIREPIAAKIYLPKSISKIPSAFFGDDDRDGKLSSTVIYAGTLDEWYNLEINVYFNDNYSNGRITLLTLEDQSFTVSFSAPDGNNIAEPVTGKYGTPIPAPSTTEYNGMVIYAWYRNKEMTDRCYPGSSPFEANETLYAKLVSPEALAMAEITEAPGLSAEDKTLGIRVEYLQDVLDASSLSIKVSEYANYRIYSDKELFYEITNSTAALACGNNVFYVKVFSADRNHTALYTLNVYRNQLYDVIYSSLGETVHSVTAEEGTALTPPAPTREGYTLTGWSAKDAPLDLASYKLSSDITLSAIWTPNSYTISFPEETGLASVGVEFDSTPTLPVATKTHYRFLGWADEEGTAVTDKDGLMLEAYTKTANTELFPLFEITEYSLSYENLEGAENANPGGYDVEEDKITLSPLVREWYTFTGWYLDEALTSSVSEIDTAKGGDLTLYAGWELTSFNVYYLADGASVGTRSFTKEQTSWLIPDVPAKQGYTASWESHTIAPRDIYINAVYVPRIYNVTYTNIFDGQNPNPLTYTVETGISLEEPTLRGYTFLGWYRNGTVCESVPVGTTGNITLRAEWEITRFSILYRNTMGASTSGFAKEYTIESPVIAIPNVSVEHYVFDGWFDESGKRVTSIAPGSAGDLILTAHFTPVAYTIKYNDIFGGQNDNPATYTVEDSITLKAPTRKGYRFTGWLDGEGNPIAAIAIGSSGEKSFTASWEIVTYTVSYENTHGADLSHLPTSFTVLSEDLPLGDIGIRGYTFEGWSLDGNTVDRIATGSAGNLTIRAILTPHAFTLMLDPVEGKLSANEKTVYFGQSFSLPVPTREHYVFLGWFDNTESSARRYTDALGSSVANYSNYTGRVLYARWAPVTFNVTYDQNKNTTPTSTLYKYGDTFDDSATPTNEGYVFAGWYSSDGKKQYTSSTILTESVTVYAKWMESTPISSADDVRAIASNPSGNYHLTRDINMAGAIWSPIGNFSGTLNGNGYAIKNFIVSSTSPSESFGFFRTNSGTVQNLRFVDFTFNYDTISTEANMNMRIGVLAANNTGKIIDCVIESGTVSVKCAIDGIHHNYAFGGLVGYNTGSVIGCASHVKTDVTVHSSDYHTGGNAYLYVYAYAGALVGFNGGTVSECFYDGTMSYLGRSRGYDSRRQTQHSSVGALVGYNSGTVKNSYTNATLSTTADVYETEKDRECAWARQAVGGIAGMNVGSVSYCYSTSKLNANVVESSYTKPSNSNVVYCTPSKFSAADVGGIVGYHSAGSVMNCYFTGSVYNSLGSFTQRTDYYDSGKTDYYASCAGGVIGKNAAVVQNSYSKGSVTVTRTSDGGGFVGYNSSSGSISKCFTAGGTVKKSSGSQGFFAGSSAGTVYSCHYVKGMILLISDSRKNHTSESGATRLTQGELRSREFLVDKLYWDEEGWIILVNDDPMLEWELSLNHSYTGTVVPPSCSEYGYTVYTCSHCDRFFLRDFVIPYGHRYSELQTIEPTCTGEGYSYETCTECEYVHVTERTAAKGHTIGELIDTKEPGCTEDGYELYSCADCGGDVKNILYRTGHDEKIDKERVEPICRDNGDGTYTEIPGATERVICTACTDENGDPTVVRESEVIPPHSFTVMSETKAPGCTEDGIGTLKCIKCLMIKEDATIPRTGHTDLNLDHKCDVCLDLCGKYDGAELIHITSVDGLRDIANNLNGNYILDADIDLSGISWTPIGTKDAPFTGYFDGNGHTIKNFSAENTGEYSGIFGYTRGIINGLKLTGARVDIIGRSMLIGFVAAYNQSGGLIINCEVSDFGFASSVEVITTGKTANEASINSCFGGIVGFNEDGALVKDCTASGKCSVYCKTSTTVETKGALNSFLHSREYAGIKAIAKNTVYVGGIAGSNDGLLDGCSSVGNIAVKFVTSATLAYMGDIWEYKRVGRADSYTELNLGTLIGVNRGEAKDSTSAATFTPENIGENLPNEAEDGSYFGVFWSWRTKVKYNSDPVAKWGVGHNLGVYN